MRWLRLPVLALCSIVIVAMVVIAFEVGPPKTPDEAPSAAAPTATPASTSARLSSDFAGFIVRGFGPVPACGDEAVASAIVEAARTRLIDKVSGLANIHSLGHFQIGDLTQWDCDASIQRGRGEQRVRYQINQVTAGHDTWEISVSGATR